MNTLGSNNVVFKNDTPTPTPTPTFFETTDGKLVAGGGAGVIVGGLVVASYYCYLKYKNVRDEANTGMGERLLPDETTPPVFDPTTTEALKKTNSFLKTGLFEKYEQHLTTDRAFFRVNIMNGGAMGPLSVDDPKFQAKLKPETLDAIRDWLMAKQEYQDKVALKPDPTEKDYEVLNDIHENYIPALNDYNAKLDAKAALQKEVSNLFSKKTDKATVLDLQKRMGQAQSEVNDARKEVLRIANNAEAQFNRKITQYPYNQYVQEVETYKQRMIRKIYEDEGSGIDAPLEPEGVAEIYDIESEALRDRIMDARAADPKDGRGLKSAKRAQELYSDDDRVEPWAPLLEETTWVSQTTGKTITLGKGYMEAAINKQENSRMTKMFLLSDGARNGPTSINRRMLLDHIVLETRVEQDRLVREQWYWIYQRLNSEKKAEIDGAADLTNSLFRKMVNEDPQLKQELEASEFSNEKLLAKVSEFRTTLYAEYFPNAKYKAELWDGTQPLLMPEIGRRRAPVSKDVKFGKAHMRVRPGNEGDEALEKWDDLDYIKMQNEWHKRRKGAILDRLEDGGEFFPINSTQPAAAELMTQTETKALKSVASAETEDALGDAITGAAAASLEDDPEALALIAL